MKFTSLYIYMALLFQLSVLGQKREINNETYKKWESLLHDKFAISNDGKFVWYAYTKDYLTENNSVVLAKSNGNFIREFPSAVSACFTEDSRNLIVSSERGITIVSLLTNEVTEMLGATEFKVPILGNGKWIAFKKGNDLIIANLHAGKEFKYNNVNRYWFDPHGTTLVMVSDEVLKLVHLSDYREIKIWQGISTNNISQVVFDNSGRFLVFAAAKSDSVAIYLFDYNVKKTEILLSDENLRGRGVLLADGGMYFSSGSEYLFFKTKGNLPSAKKDSNVITKKVDLWHYKDETLQSQQLTSPYELFKRQYTTAINLKSRKIVYIESLDTALIWQPSAKYAVIKTVTNQTETFWNEDRFPKCHLLNLSNGMRRAFIPESHRVLGAFLSPGGKFVVWIDEMTNQFYCYNILNEKIINVTKALDQSRSLWEDTLCKEKYDYVNWIADDKAVLFYSQYDIWQFDPMKGECLNITAGYGKENSTPLKIAIESSDVVSLKNGDSLLLVGISDTTKSNGFFKVRLSTEGRPWVGRQSACAYYYPYMMGPDRPPSPRKAKEANMYVLLRQSSTEAPNIVATSDFNTFYPISNLSPQRFWKWMTTELVTWDMPDGNKGKGILFKPEDFDSTRKYPIIFNYYDIRSNDCYQFRGPSLSIGDLDIAWYVSNGYLIFMPDIVRIKEKTGWSALNSVLSAATYLTSKYPWINSKKMGLQGHSFGGYETNYIVANCNFFAAAQSSAGVSDCINGYSGLGFGERSLADLYEAGQMNLGAAPWEKIDVYINNSPIFNVGKVTTPLLLMHNKKDYVVPFNQSLELFLALRRLKKPVWLLQYDEQAHILDGGSEQALDFTLRQQQFFDHYLKDKPAPQWLVNPIPAYLKGVKSGL